MFVALLFYGVTAYIQHMTKLIVFDCDGTLVDSQHVIQKAAATAFEACGLAVPSDHSVRRIVGLSLPEAMRVLYPDGADDDRIINSLTDAYKQAFFTIRSSPDHMYEPLYPGIAEILVELTGQDFKLAVATGKSMRGLRAVLEHHDLKHYFISLQTADFHPSKPHPAMLEAAMKEAKAKPHDTVLIGDTSYDMLMAGRAGAHGLGVSWGYHDEDDLVGAGATLIAQSAYHLPSHIAQLLEEVTS